MAKTPKGERTRAQIFAAATEIIAEAGLEGATMRAIAERAGVSTGAAYHYIRSKDELVLALYARTQESLEAHAQLVAEAGGDLTQRLTAMLWGGLLVLAPQRELLGRLAAAVLVPGSPLSPFAPETIEIRKQAIENFRVALGPHDENRIAELAWMAWMAVILYWLNDRSEGQEATQALIDASVPTLVHAMPLFGGMLFEFAAIAERGLLGAPDPGV